jgi:hypothetical protein
MDTIGTSLARRIPPYVRLTLVRSTLKGVPLMTAQDRVFECYPDAEARQAPAIFEHGTDDPIECGYWAVFAGPEYDAEELGRGRSETEAWSDAAGLQGNQAA